tara:strand:+ start:324 stop:518 length:195 start_codon:yes stop_codon:yes gene_type:complete
MKIKFIQEIINYYLIYIMEIEKLDVANIIEIQEIRKLLINHPDLLSMFEILIVMCNNRLEEEEQ